MLKLHLFDFVVDLLYNLLYNKSTTSRNVYNKSKAVQQIHNILTCQDVVDLLWTCRRVAANHQGRSDEGEYFGIYIYIYPKKSVTILFACG